MSTQGSAPSTEVLEPFVQVYPSAPKLESDAADVTDPSQSLPAPASISIIKSEPPTELHSKPVASTSVDASVSESPFDAESQTVIVEPVKLLSPSIVRAQLTHNVVNHEPVDKLGDVITMNDKGLLRVYLFTEMVQLQGKTLYHNWYRDGKLMAHVRIPVGYVRTRASSSKFIDRYMLGEWSVKVVDENKKEYITARFEVPKN